MLVLTWQRCPAETRAIPHRAKDTPDLGVSDAESGTKGKAENLQTQMLLPVNKASQLIGGNNECELQNGCCFFPALQQISGIFLVDDPSWKHTGNGVLGTVVQSS